MGKRVSYEQPIVDDFAAIARPVNGRPFRGFGKANRIGPGGWGLTANQEFQFGDFRVELDDRHVVVEIDGAGDVTNLAKYWPLARCLDRHLFLIHVYGINSAGDYVSRRMLWRFLYDEMRKDPACTRFAAWQFQHGVGAGSSYRKAQDRFRECLAEPIPYLIRLRDET